MAERTLHDEVCAVPDVRTNSPAAVEMDGGMSTTSQMIEAMQGMVDGDIDEEMW